MLLCPDLVRSTGSRTGKKGQKPASPHLNSLGPQPSHQNRNLTTRCPLWVNNGPRDPETPLPLCLDQRTSSDRHG